MAEKLSITIALIGAEEIKRQLAEVGKAGQDCFKDINEAAAEVGGFNKLDPSVITEKLKATGVAGNDVAKVLTAVSQAGRMETLINALTSVENGLAKIQSAATAVDGALGKQLVRSLTLVARLLPAAFAASVVASITNATKAILELDAAAIKLGISVGDLNKAREMFKGLGIDSKTAAEGVAAFVGNIEKDVLEKVKAAGETLKEFGTSTEFGAQAMITLRKAAAGGGESAALAIKILRGMGQLDLSQPAKDIEKMNKSAASTPDKMIGIISVLEKMGNTAERNRLVFENFSSEFGTKLIQMMNAGIPITAQLIAELAKIPAVTQESITAATLLGLEWQKIKNMFTGATISAKGLDEITASLQLIRTVATAIGNIPFIAGSMNMGNTLRELQFIGQVLTQIGQLAVTVWNGFVQGASTAIQQVLQFFAQMPQQIISYFAGLGSSLWDGIVTAAQTAWQTIVGYIQTAINKLREFLSAGGGRAAGAGAGGMARGGLMGGRGTGTSDSNLAWLSRGEHVMPAYAVRQPGVLQLLEALRRSGGNLRSVLDRMGHFALGGMVGVPAFASGGSVGGMNNVTIQFPGVQPITGLRASSAVVDELRRSAALAQVRSGGRKPSRYT